MSIVRHDYVIVAWHSTGERMQIAAKFAETALFGQARVVSVLDASGDRPIEVPSSPLLHQTLHATPISLAVPSTRPAPILTHAYP